MFIPTTGEQVNRARKGDRLPVIQRNARGPERRTEAPPPPRTEPAQRAALSEFYAALDGLRTGARREPVTILHLGDSHIASDRFTGDLRDLLQARFGDAGRGLMMPGFPFDYYRARGVRFTKSKGWTSASSLKSAAGSYGLTGVRLSSRAKEAWLRLDSKDGPFEWAEVTFLTGRRHGTAVVSVDSTSRTVKTTAADGSPKTVRMQHKGSSLTVKAKGDGPVTVLSWAVGQDRPGIRYVNLGIPSATADITRRWSGELMAADFARLKPNLVVLGYGTNEGFHDKLDVAAYERRYEALVRRLQNLAPNASFLVIGPPDSARFPRFARKGRKYAELKSVACRVLSAQERQSYPSLVKARSDRIAGWHVPPKLGAVRAALKRVAERGGAYFWDWSGIMGGACGVHDWATAEPALVMADHVHMTAEGSQRTARALYDELMAGFAAHRKVASR
ncbi:MAG: GDSL-type esterase/lipase family protein [Hyphomicrobiales bacterium]|nr:GDSL-type esterase/lipase family protein [Hyphomicrobiales bacterium]